MRSFNVVPGQSGLAQQFDNLRHDAAGGGFLHAHQMLGYLSLPDAPTNGQTVTLDINGTNIVLTAVGSIGTATGNVLNPGTAAGFAANVLALLLQPQTTTANGIALSTADQQFLSYLSFSLVGTTIYISSSNLSLYAPLSSFSASTNVTGASWTAQTMQLYVQPGTVYVNGTRVLFSGGSSPTVTAPSSHPRIDVLTIDNTGTLAWTTGSEASSPSTPTYPADKIALCELYNVVGETALYDNANQQTGQGYISNDVRPILGLPFNSAAIPDSMLPSSDDALNLGSNSFRWANIYGVEFYGDASNMTGLSSNYISDLYTAGMNGNAGDALIALPYSSVQVTLDAKGKFSGSGSPTISQSFTVGSNSNRALVVAIDANGLSSGHSITGVTYAGASMTRMTTAPSGSFGTAGIWYLEAPATGPNNIVITLSTTDASTVYFNVNSYYNAAQTSTPEANAVSNVGTNESVSITPLTNGGVAFGFAASSGSIGGAAVDNHESNTTAYSGDSGPIYPMAAQTFTSTTSSSAVHAISIAPFMSSVTMRVYKASSAIASTATPFIGFATASYTAASSVRAVIGGTGTGLSGLTIGAPYYLNDTAGSIGTSAGTVTKKVGIALTATTLLVTNIW